MIAAANPGGRSGPRTCGNVGLAVINLILNLEGFDFAAFLLSAVVVFLLSASPSITWSGGKEWGHTGIPFYATLGAYAGLCAHDWWLRPYGAYEPYLTIVVVVGGLLATVLAMTAVALR